MDKSILSDLYNILSLIVDGDSAKAGELLKKEFYPKYIATDEESRATSDESEKTGDDNAKEATGTTLPTATQTGDAEGDQPAQGSINTKAN